jgi:hypothetical protein
MNPPNGHGEFARRNMQRALCYFAQDEQATPNSDWQLANGCWTE